MRGAVGSKSASRHMSQDCRDNKDNGRNSYARSKPVNRRRNEGRGGEREAVRDRENSKQKAYGFVLSLKESFGFILPYIGDEHLYFNERDAPYDIAEGDEVEFLTKKGQRGPAAVSVRRVDVENVRQAEGEGGGTRCKGIVSWEADPYKFTPGVITLSTSDELGQSGGKDSSRTASFLYTDLRGGGAGSGKRVMKGDEVEFDLFVIPGTAYARAKDIVVHRTKRDRMISEQIKMFADAGVKMEQGVIDSIKSDYGFIRACDRADHLFFRLDDIVDQDTLPNESDEVEFYVISEHSRGKLSDRAVHISYLPHGTVSFEHTLAEEVQAVVSIEPRLHPREEPGTLRLCSPVTLDDGTTLETVELWPRCLPEGMGTMLRVGDVLTLDVTKYRPEKLVFARNVKVASLRGIGRCHGVVCDVKESRGYGFIRFSGDVDAYFRVNEVLDSMGEILDEKAIKMSMAVTCEIILEAVGNSGENKLRAVRVQVADRPGDTRAVLKEGVRGVVVRESKKDSAGIIEVVPEDEDTLPTVAGDMLAAYSNLMAALRVITETPDIKEVVLDYVLPAQRFAIHTLVREHFAGLGHQTLSAGGSGELPGRGKAVRLWKIEDSEEYSKWAQENQLSEEGADGNQSSAGGKGGDGKRVRFQRNDVEGMCNGGGGVGLGSVRVGAQVVFDLCVDRQSASRVASSVRVKDVAVPGAEMQFGVVEFVRAKDSSAAGAVGYIRCIPTDEKLLWLSSSTEGAEDNDGKSEAGTPDSFAVGTQVFFCIRNRGGVRYASAVTVKPPPASAPEAEALKSKYCNEIVLEGDCVGVLVEGPAAEDTLTGDGTNMAEKSMFVYPVDFSQCPELAKKMVDIPGAAVRVLEKKNAHRGMTASTGTDENLIWEKKQQPESGETKPDISVKPSVVPMATATVASSSEGVAVYYPPSPVVPIPITSPLDNLPPVGSLVKFSAVVNWVKQRTPLRASNVELFSPGVLTTPPTTTQDEVPSSDSVTPLSNLLNKTSVSNRNTAGAMVKGVIIRLKINASGVDLAEIAVSEDYRHKLGLGIDDVNYYCDSRDLRSSSIHVGDEVEFFPASLPYAASGVIVRAAVMPILVKPGIGRVAAPKKRNPINATLKQNAKGGFMNTVTMAQGPPEDAATGFSKGWRGDFEFNVAELPWAKTLLPHLCADSHSVVESQSVSCEEERPAQVPDISKVHTGNNQEALPQES